MGKEEILRKNELGNIYLQPERVQILGSYLVETVRRKLCRQMTE